jgi:hypothetical protein
MTLKRAAPQASVSEVLDRVLDRGIVIDVWLRVSVVGIDLVDVNARVVVASIDTHVRHAGALTPTATIAAPTSGRRPPTRTTRPARLRLQCASGCTFTRSARRRPTAVRCPAARGRSCPVTVVAPAA